MIKNKLVMIPIYLFHHEGSRMISAYMKNKGFDIDTIYFCDMWKDPEPSKKNFELLYDKLAELKPTIVGLSFFCTHRVIANKIAEYCRKKLGVLVVAGGVQATIEPEDTLRFSDISITGDGEEPMKYLMNNYCGDKKIFKKVPGAKFLDKKGRIKNGVNNIYNDLNELPFPDLDFDSYFISAGKITKGYNTESVQEFEVSGSRGCPFNCSYCSNSFLNELEGRPRVRVKGAEYLLLEVERAKKSFKNLKRIVFGDEMFVSRKDILFEFLRQYPKRIGLPFTCLFHPDCIDEETLKKLIVAGMKMGRCGIQAMSQKTRKEIYNRNTKDEDILKVATLFKKYKGVRLAFDLIVNNPLENEKDILDGYNFMLTLPTGYELLVHVLFHLPKTKLTNILLEKKIITLDNIEGYNAHPTKWGLNILEPDVKYDFSYTINKFWIYMATLLSKKFIPRKLLKVMAKSKFLRKHNLPLYIFTYGVNMFNLLLISINMVKNKEASLGGLLKIVYESKFSILKTNK